MKPITKEYIRKFSVLLFIEMGMDITIKSGKKIRIMSNNLETDEIFMKRLRELYFKGDDTFAQYLEDGTYLKGNEKFNEKLQELQERMRKT